MRRWCIVVGFIDFVNDVIIKGVGGNDSAFPHIEPEDFQEFKRIFEQDCEKARHALESQQAQMEAILNSGDPASPWIKYFERFGRVEELTRAIAVKFIEQVNVFEGGRLEITFRYQEEYEMARQFLAIHRQSQMLKEAV